MLIAVEMPQEETAPQFIKQLENKDVFETTSVRLECEVIGCPEPEITWYQVWEPFPFENDRKM